MYHKCAHLTKVHTDDNGKETQIDIGMSRGTYGTPPEVLEILPQGRVKVSANVGVGGCVGGETIITILTNSFAFIHFLAGSKLQVEKIGRHLQKGRRFCNSCSGRLEKLLHSTPAV
jgi:hypothetical protein